MIRALYKAGPGHEYHFVAAVDQAVLDDLGLAVNGDSPLVDALEASLLDRDQGVLILNRATPAELPMVLDLSKKDPTEA